MSAAPISPSQAAKILGVSPKTLRRWAMDGVIPASAISSTFGGHFRYRPEVLQKLSEDKYQELTAVTRMRVGR